MKVCTGDLPGINAQHCCAGTRFETVLEHDGEGSVKGSKLLLQGLEGHGAGLGGVVRLFEFMKQM